MRITSKGQVTIPRDIRDAPDIVPSSEVEFVRKNGRLWLCKRKPAPAIPAGWSRARGRATVHPDRGRTTMTNPAKTG
jgi:AbrB family looped-hinge helix DNA binding protein